mgnify:CR=1 FL=1
MDEFGWLLFDLSALTSRTPMQAMKDWHKTHPHLFVKSPRNHAGRDSYGPKLSLRNVGLKCDTFAKLDFNSATFVDSVGNYFIDCNQFT